jgi:hypothetical protein
MPRKVVPLLAAMAWLPGGNLGIPKIGTGAGAGRRGRDL